MFALLGDIRLHMHTSPQTLDGTFGSDFAGLERISGKPGLQHTGDRLDEYSLGFALHHNQCDPQAVWRQLEDARKSHRAQALVLGSDYRGYFVITDTACNLELADQNGNIQGLAVTLTLREFTGDPAAPLKPPSLPGVNNGRTGIRENAAAVKAAAPPGSVAALARTASRQAKSAQGALRRAAHVVQVAQQFKHDPAGAMQRVPGMLNSFGGVTDALGQALPALSGVSGVIQDMAPAVKSLSAAADQLQQATGMLRNLQTVTAGDPRSALSVLSPAAGSISGIFDAVPALADTAGKSLRHAAPALSRLDALIVTRRV